MTGRLSTVVLALALTGSACSKHSPDRALGYGRKVDQFTEPKTVMDVPVMGFDTRIKTHSGRKVRGELISVDPEGDVVIQDRDAPQRVRIPFAQIDVATIRVADTRKMVGGIGGWMAGGIVASLGLGFGFFLVAPAWALVGTGAMVTASEEGKVRLRKEGLLFLFQYARHPQGEPQPWEPATSPRPAEETDAPPIEPMTPAEASDETTPPMLPETPAVSEPVEAPVENVPEAEETTPEVPVQRPKSAPGG